MSVALPAPPSGNGDAPTRSAEPEPEPASGSSGTAEASGSGSAEPAEEAAAALIPEAGDVMYAQLWYYEDRANRQQGPFPSAEMRSWFVNGMIPPSTPVAPSYYGEVPSQMWPVNKLWARPQAQAFVLSSAVEAAVAPTSSNSAEFIPSERFGGRKEGYIFKLDDMGVGYYRDEPPEIRASAAAARASCTPSHAPRHPGAAHGRRSCKPTRALTLAAPSQVTASSIEEEKNRAKRFKADAGVPRFDTSGIGF